MTKINLFMNTLFLLITILFSAIPECSCAISDKRLCYDPECSEIISLAKTVIRYLPNDPELIPFDINANAKVYSKSAGKRKDLWGVEINGKRGYVSKTFLKEYKVIHKKLEHEVPTISIVSDKEESVVKDSQPKQENVKSTKQDHESLKAETKSSNGKVTDVSKDKHLNGASPSYEVIDGTTLNLDHDEPSLQPSFVREVISATAVPNDQKPIDIPGIDPAHEKSKTHFVESTEPSDTDTVTKQEVDNHEVKESIPEKPLLVTSELPGNSSETTSVNDTPILEATVERKLDTTDKTSEILNGINLKNTSVVNDIDPVEKIENLSPKESLDTESTENIQSTEKVPNSAVDAPLNSLNIIQETNKPNVTLENDVTDTVNEKIELEEISEKPTVGEVNAKASEENKSNSESTNGPVEQNTSIPLESTLELNTDETLLKTQLIDEPLTDEKNSQINETVSDYTGSNTSIDPFESNISGTDKTTEISVEASDKGTVDSQGFAEEVVNAQSIIENASVASKNDFAFADSPNEISDLGKTSSFINESNIVETLPENTNVSSSDVGDLATPENEHAAETSVSDVEHTTESVTALASNGTSEHTSTLKDDAVAVVEHTAESSTIIASNETSEYTNTLTIDRVIDSTTTEKTTAQIDVNKNDKLVYGSGSAEVPIQHSDSYNDKEFNLKLAEQSLYSSQANLISEQVSVFNEFHNRNLLNVDKTEIFETENTATEGTDYILDKTLPKYEDDISNKVEVLDDSDLSQVTSIFQETPVLDPEVCTVDTECESMDNILQSHSNSDESLETTDNVVIHSENVDYNYWLLFMYVAATAVTVLVFSLGYYYIENMKRDRELIAKINKLEKDLLVSMKECTMLSENLVSTKEKLACIEDESFGSNEMVLSLKADLEASQNAKCELEDQVYMLERELENATEAGLELERMLREVLSANNEVNPLAKSVEDLQARLNNQQAENESITSALTLKIQESDQLSADLAFAKKRLDDLEAELARVSASSQQEITEKISVEQKLTEKVQQLEMQLKKISSEKVALQKELKSKQVELKNLSDVISQFRGNNLDLEKLYDVSHIKAEATALLEERDELKVRLSEVEGAHNLLEEHMKLVKEEISSVSEQCKLAEKEKKDAETRLEVLTNFFNEREAQRQKEEAMWLQKQGEVVSTVERIQTMQNEIHNYKQQTEMLKHEILDQEREYKTQISLLETKAHEQWVMARQLERRLEESKAEAGQLRNRLTLIEKNINDADSEAKLHRLEANGETATSPPLFIGAESSSSPIMFSGSSSVPPPPPPSYMHSIFPPYMPPPLPSSGGVPSYEVGQRPPPLGGRLSSPPPMPLLGSGSGRYENANSPPPPMSPHLLPPFNHRSPPPPFGSDHLHPPLPPPPGSILPPPLGTTHSWGEESLQPMRNTSFQPHHREQRVRNHKGSLHSSGESLDKTQHISKV